MVRPCTSTPRRGFSPSTRSRAAWTWRFWSTRIAVIATSSPDTPSTDAVIDLKLLRNSPDQVRAALARRADPAVLGLLGELESLDARRRTLAGELDGLKAERNTHAL